MLFRSSRRRLIRSQPQRPGHHVGRGVFPALRTPPGGEGRKFSAGSGIESRLPIPDNAPFIIFRPVFIVAKPAQNIDRLVIDAKADGNFYADCFLNMAVEGARVHTVITRCV